MFSWFSFLSFISTNKNPKILEVEDRNLRDSA
jgi:hypothetical protein